jgi:hypothetical protein
MNNSEGLEENIFYLSGVKDGMILLLHPDIIDLFRVAWFVTSATYKLKLKDRLDYKKGIIMAIVSKYEGVVKAKAAVELYIYYNSTITKTKEYKKFILSQLSKIQDEVFPEMEELNRSKRPFKVGDVVIDMILNKESIIKNITKSFDYPISLNNSNNAYKLNGKYRKIDQFPSLFLKDEKPMLMVRKQKDNE